MRLLVLLLLALVALSSAQYISKAQFEVRLKLQIQPLLGHALAFSKSPSCLCKFTNPLISPLIPLDCTLSASFPILITPLTG